MFTYTLKERTIPLDDTYDVIVVGGGPSGCTAAAAAAREGARTLLLEATSCLGGMGTAAMVPAWCPFTDGEKIIYGGMAEKVFMRSKAGMAHVKKEEIHGWLPLDPEGLKRIYDDLVREAGAKVLFETRLSSMEMEEPGKVSALIVTNKAGLKAYRAKVYVDCTGDGDLAAWAGAGFWKGEKGSGLLMGMTLCFLLSNVDSYAFQNFYDPAVTGNWMFKESPMWKIIDSKKYDDIGGFCANLVGPGTVGFNALHIFGADPLNPEDMSDAYMKARELAYRYREALAEFFPQAFGNAHMAATGALMGVRETRRIKGDYCLTVEDYRDKHSFSDEICRNSYIVDIHNEKEPEIHPVTGMPYNPEEEYYRSTPGSEVRQYRNPKYPFYEVGDSHGIPYRCLTPKGLTNVLVAGRSISCERVVQSSIRVMPVCLCMGEAAGMAAVLAINSSNCDIHRIDTDYLRKRLREEGAYLP
jgi:hypothetical protein